MRGTNQRRNRNDDVQTGRTCYWRCPGCGRCTLGGGMMEWVEAEEEEEYEGAGWKSVV